MLVNFMVLNILFRAVVCEVHFRVLNIYTMGRRKTSVVWDHFVIKSVVNGNKKYQVATCVVCQEDTKFSRNTTNQLYHLRTHHPDVYKLAEPNIQKPPRKPKENDESTASGLLDHDEDNMSIGR